MIVRPLHVAVAAIAAAAIVVPVIVVLDPPKLPRPDVRAQVAAQVLARRPQRVVSPAELPEVEPVELVALTPDDARAYNASIPFVPGPKPAARPFRFAGSAEELARATDCLAAAVIYEAGDDAVGERAVAQVVLNRLRHPAFPKTVCGVVFQGQERRTGCQFTFTCDGALGRAPSEGGWRRAREVAAMALKGNVYRPVGLATHYHTDWVVPYWSSSLDKVAEVHTHLFFRWSGWWGTPPAFDRRPSGAEPVIQKIAFLSDAHKEGAAMTEADAAFAEAVGAALLADRGAPPQAVGDQENTFLQTLPRGVVPDQWPAYASRLCGERPYCKVLAWTDGRPAALPLTPGQQERMAFSYLRDRPNGFEKPLWNCTQVPRASAAQCMKTQVYQPAAPARDAILPRGPTPLEGVRRKVAPPAAADPATPTGVTPRGTSPAAEP